LQVCLYLRKLNRKILKLRLQHQGFWDLCEKLAEFLCPWTRSTSVKRFHPRLIFLGRKVSKARPKLAAFDCNFPLFKITTKPQPQLQIKKNAEKQQEDQNQTKWLDEDQATHFISINLT